jgi:hypothetical protein
VLFQKKDRAAVLSLNFRYLEKNRDASKKKQIDFSR